MYEPDTTLEIQTLGCFSISINGIPVATEWPDETQKVLFCSLLSPLDLYFTWDRICNSIWDAPVTRNSKRRLESTIIRPLQRFLIKEIGFNPLVVSPKGIRIDLQCIHVDAHEFYRNVLEGHRLSSLDNSAVAFEKFTSATSLYLGLYLPEFKGKIISNARRELESFYRSAIMHGARQAAVCNALTTEQISALAH
jgi:DNA-binding SARP family transcriptional activator